ncbi:MAG: hypothetical protein PVH61_22480 [Candidatus Aminicenantes bacterium]|jgi:hypothetical protein
MKKILFIMFILINILALMTLTGCRKESDITGIWFITTTLLGETSTNTYTFSGTKDWGVVLLEGQALGNYSVDGGNVNFTLEYLNADENQTVVVYTGLYDGKDFMSGSFTYTIYTAEENPSSSGTWFGER